MPQLIIYLASLLAVVVTTGAALDKFNARRPVRASVWLGLLLLGLPASFIAFYLVLLVLYGGDFWFY